MIIQSLLNTMIRIPVIATILSSGLICVCFSMQEYTMRFEFPYGVGTSIAAVPRGGHVQALISIESFVHEPRHIEAIVKYPPGLSPCNLSQYRDDSYLKFPFELRTENDIWYHLVEFAIDSFAKTGEYVIECSADMQNGIEKVRTPFYIVDSGYVGAHVKLSKFITPSDAEGKPIGQQQENTFIIKDPASRMFRSFFVSKSEHDGEHVAFELQNTGEYPVLLNVDYLICNAVNGEPVEWLQNLREESGLSAKGINVQVFIKPHSSTLTVLNILSREELLAPGEYTQKISSSLLTSQDIFLKSQLPLHIREVNITNVSATVFAFIVAVFGTIILFVFRKKLLTKITSREYILIAQYAAIAFSIVIIPSTILSSLLHAFLGPFSFLVSGLFSEIITYLLMVSLVVLLPRPGVITCFLLIKFLLSAIIFGNLSIFSILWFPMRAVILELAFYFAGFFDSGETVRIQGSTTLKPHQDGVPKLLWSALVIAIADTLLAFISLNMSMFFYRLFYAEWYIWLYISVSGFLYTFIAVPFAIRMGNSLKRVVID